MKVIFLILKKSILKLSKDIINSNNTDQLQESNIDPFVQRLVIYVKEQYEKFKDSESYIDYNDMINHVLILLNSPEKDWVSYKINQKLHHILIDEAQDNSNLQWAIIDILCSDICAGSSLDQSIKKKHFYCRRYKNNQYTASKEQIIKCSIKCLQKFSIKKLPEK